MNRELKFRLWNSVWKKMNYDCGMGVKGNKLIEDKHNVLMQKIGRKDKNEKEIYEGDYVLIGNSIGENLGGIVKWNKEYVQFMVVDDTNRENHCFEHDFELNEIKVIGNIWETPNPFALVLNRETEANDEKI